MKKVIVLFFFLWSTFFHSLEEKEVYICYSKTATKYHFKETCRGLNACKHEIKKVTLKQAKDRGLELCGWED